LAREVTTIIRSDLSGDVVPEDQVVLVTFEFGGRKNRVELDVGEWEVAELIEKGREIKRRGRPPGSRNRSKAAQD
jgi:hypothetical protein